MSDLEDNGMGTGDTNRSRKSQQKDNAEEVKSKTRSSSSDSSKRSRSRSKSHSRRKSESRKHRRHRRRSPRSHSHRHHHHKSKHRRSRSRERSHRDRPSHKRHGSSHKSKGNRRSRSPRKRSRSPRKWSRSPRKRSRSPRHKNNSRSPQQSKSNRRTDRSASPDPFLGAMAAQERLAQRMDKAKMRQRVKERRGNGWNGGARNKMSSEEKEKKYEEQKKEAKEMLEKAGVNIPSYYNPFAVNPMQIAKQSEKRKKLWAKKEDPKTDTEPTKTATTAGAMWSKMNFGDSKSNEKFAKLMGIKNPEELAKKLEGDSAASELIKKQHDVFKNLDQQYTQARITTHTQRGIGLGFTTNFVDPNTVPQALVGGTNIPPTTKP